MSLWLYEKGQSLVEYMLILSIVALVVLGALMYFGIDLGELYAYIRGEFESSI
jgi:Flp pilus assembly pilin Flp